MPPARRTAEMHRGRISVATGVYFVTCCTEKRRDGLLAPRIANPVLEVVKASDRAQETRTFAFTLMPDHCHWLFRLGARLSLGQTIAKLKSMTRADLQLRELSWQRNFYEHHLRPEETPEDYALYIFLNPYRAGLCGVHEAWPYWWSGEMGSLRFVPLLRASGAPPPEWIDRPLPVSVQHGE